jgi:hypothetical protein
MAISTVSRSKDSQVSCSAVPHYCCLFGKTLAPFERGCGLGLRGARTETSGSGWQTAAKFPSKCSGAAAQLPRR